jgi:hypothetical protein
MRLFRIAASVLLISALPARALAQWNVEVTQDKLTDQSVLKATVNGYAENKALYQLTMTCNPSSGTLSIADPFSFGELSVTTFDANGDGRPIPFNVGLANSDVARFMLSSRVEGVTETRSVRLRLDTDTPKSATVVRDEFDNRANFFMLNKFSGLPTTRLVLANVFADEVVEFPFHTLTPEQRQTIQTQCFDGPPVVAEQIPPRQPRLLKEVQPQFTKEGLQVRAQGEVTLKCIVQTTGVPTDCAVVASRFTYEPLVKASVFRRSGPSATNGPRTGDNVPAGAWGLEAQAMSAVQQWRFMPGTRLGKPAPMLVTIALAFSPR